MIRPITKMNSTGSLYHNNINNDIVSYSTPIYREYTLSNGKVLKVFNDTFYSMTTRKHQGLIWRYRTQSDIVFHYCPYGNWSLDTAFKNEISMTEYKLEKLQNKTRKLGKRQAEELETLKDRLNTLQKLYKEI